MVSDQTFSWTALGERTLVDGTLSTHLLDLEAAAVSHGEVIAASLESVSTVSERALVSAQVVPALSDLTSVLLGAVAGMSSGLLSEKGSSCESGNKLHVERWV
jgi:hypothetical protein